MSVFIIFKCLNCNKYGIKLINKINLKYFIENQTKYKNFLLQCKYCNAKSKYYKSEIINFLENADKARLLINRLNIKNCNLSKESKITILNYGTNNKWKNYKI